MRYNAVPLNTLALRTYTAPPDAIKLYESNFTAGPFPVEFAQSDVVQYAQFLYKLGEQKNENYLKDFDALAKLKLPVFWERGTDVTGYSDVTKVVSANFVFCLRWMQVEDNLEKVASVRSFYETLLNAKLKKSVVNVFTNAESVSNGELQQLAKAKVVEMMKTHPVLKPKAGYTLEYKFTVDSTVPKGSGLFYAEVEGVSISTIPQIRSDEVSGPGVGEVDYTNVVSVKQILKTVWPDNIETDVLRKYLDYLAQLDMEEQIVGV